MDEKVSRVSFAIAVSGTKVIWIMIKQIINNAEFYLNNKNIITLLSIFHLVDRSWKLNL